MIDSKFHHVAKGLCMGLLAIASLSSYAIENGQHDYMHHNVGALGFDIDGPDNPTPPFGLCSGFVISDRAFVTAAHCIIFPGPYAQSWAVTLEPGTPDNPVILPGIFTGGNVFDFPMLVETINTIAVHMHPDFDPGSMTFDVAVLEFPPGTFKVRPVRLPEPYYLDKLDNQGVLYRRPVGLVGYGMLALTNEGYEVVPGYRSRGFSKVSGITDDQLFLTPTDVFDARLMNGDSGSPQFISGRAVSLTGIVDLQRLDIPEVLDFLAPFIE